MKCALAVILLLAAMRAQADWVRIAEVKGQAIIYVDPSTVQKNEAFRRLWELYDFAARSPDGDLSIRSFAEYDCPEKRARTLSGSSFSDQMASGRTVVSSIPPAPWDYIAPGSVRSIVLKYVCSQ